MKAAVLLLIASTVEGSIPKRGFSGFLGAHFTCQDAAALKLDGSWSYTWTTNPSQYNKCKTAPTAEFVPMVNGVGQAKRLVTSHIQKAWKAANVRYLLGYNEPDYGNGHNHPHQASPAKAAADWPDVQRVAAQMAPEPLVLVGPAVSSGAESGGNDAWDADGRSTWLDEFFGNCTHVVAECDPLLIKYIAMHDYQGNVTKLQRRITGAAKRYQRPIWLTEFAITKWGAAPNRSQQDTYMKEVLPYLDSSDDVFRYAWFSARNAPNKQNGGSNLLPCDANSTTPTSTGAIYSAGSLHE